MKRTILMALMSLDTGGAETHVVELSKELRRMGYDIAIVSNGGVYVPELEEAGIRHYQVPMHRRSPLLMLKSLLLLRRVIAREKPSLVHAHARIPAFLCGLLQRVMRFPFVTSCHGVYQVSGMLRRISSWGDRSIAVSEDIRDYLVQEYGVPRDNIQLTINGIDVSRFSPDTSPAPIRAELGLTGGPVVVHVSRLDGVVDNVARLLIALAPRLSEEIPGIQLVITGGGVSFEELRTQAETVNARLGRRCLILTGPRTDVHQILSAGDLFVGVSRAALEAMASGLPTVMAGFQGFGGLFGQDLLDLAVSSNFCFRGCALPTEDGLTSAILQGLALPPEERQRLGSYGRQVVCEHYSVRRMTEDCLGVYRQVWRPVQVVMSGYYGFNNLGDEAILLSIQRRLSQVDPGISLTVLSNDPAQTAGRYGVNAVPRFHLLKVRKALKRCDLLLSGGGSLLQDRTSTRSLIYYLSIIQLARHYKKPVLLYANGIGPVAKPGNRERVRRVLDTVDVITLREENSKTELLSMGVTNPHMIVTADPVFTIAGVPREQAMADLEGRGIPTDRPLMGISVRSTAGMAERLAGFARFFDQAADEYGCTPVFLVMQLPGDRVMSERVMSVMKTPAYLYESPYDPEAMMGVISYMECVLSTRLHTLIFSAKQRVPLLGFIYDPKVESYLETLGMPSGGRPEEFDPEQAMEALRGLMARRDEAKSGLDAAVARLEALAQENERQLIALLEDA
ncbi:MAG: polysaccharide pyruvyl transferase CsaB [Oscillospiraceae bacterium]|nr:polysaccharide pyruvyl transferase CsaB [Oscillospiraceae bacterium]